MDRRGAGKDEPSPVKALLVITPHSGRGAWDVLESQQCLSPTTSNQAVEGVWRTGAGRDALAAAGLMRERDTKSSPSTVGADKSNEGAGHPPSTQACYSHLSFSADLVD